MNPLVLEAELLTGLDSIDDQHRHLLELANRVVQGTFAHFGHEWYCDALGAFIDYTHYHFSAEEHLMRRVDYPSFEAHRTWHDQFRLELNEVADATRRAPVTAAHRARLAQMVESFLFEHARVTDKQLADYALAHDPGKNLRLADSATLRRAGALVADIEQADIATGTDPTTR